MRKKNDFEARKTRLREEQGWWPTRFLGRVYNNLGYLDWNEGHFGSALTHFRHAVKCFGEAETEFEKANALNNLAFILALLGRSPSADQCVEGALEIRHRLGRKYWIALSMNTRGIIDALHDHPLRGEKSCRNALAICEMIQHARGIGLACLGLGFVLRKRGHQWTQEVYSHQDAEKFFDEADVQLQRARDIFSRQVTDEPLRLWEAYNELGSLCCDRGWLHWKGFGNNQKAAMYYDQSIDYQNRALKVAEDHNWKFQVADSLDDLAQVYSDKGFLWANVDAGKACRSAAASSLVRIEGMIPAKFQLVAGEGFHQLARPGEAFLLSLGKVHLQYGIWLFREVEQESLSGNTRLEKLREGIQQFAIATAYFQRYWPESHNLGTNLNAFAKRLQLAEVPPEFARSCVRQVAKKYRVNLDALLDTIDNALGA